MVLKGNASGVQFFRGIPYRVFYRPVKYARLEFLTGVLHLILPPGMKPEEILSKKEQWIRRKYQLIQNSLVKAKELPMENRSRNELKELVLAYVAEAERLLGVKVRKVQIRKMRTKWGSCSNRGTVTINVLARFLPDDLLKYLVFHEVNHMRHWRHDRFFWKSLRKVFGDVNKFEEQLTFYWFRLNDLQSKTDLETTP